MTLDGKLSIFILGFITLIIGLSLIPSLAEQQNSITETSTSDDEAVTLASSTVTLTFDDLTANPSFFGNATVNTSMTGLGFDTNAINVTLATGIIVTNGTYADGSGYNVTYGYFPGNYLKNSAARALLRITTLLFVLAVLIIGGIKLFTDMSMDDLIGKFKK